MILRGFIDPALRRAPGLLIILALLLLPAGRSHAAPGSPCPEDDQAVTEPAEAAGDTGEETAADGEGPAGEEEQKSAFRRFFSDWRWLKWLHDTTEGTSRGAAQWFDGFFGSNQLEQEADVSFGRLGLGLRYDEREDFSPEARFRARLVFPQMDNRFNMIIGRLDADEYITDTYEGFEALPDTFNAAEDNDWLLGFGYNPVRRKRSNLHFSVGAKFTWPPEPYVKARYYYKFITGSRSQVRTQETVSWRSEEGWGALTQINFEYMPAQRHLIRWANGLEVGEIYDDLVWQSRLTLYQNLSEKAAMAYQIGARGETGKPDPIEYYGFRLVYRRNFRWEWFFWEARTGVMWPRNETLATPAPYDRQSHEAVPYIFLGIEMFFGKGPMISSSLD